MQKKTQEPQKPKLCYHAKLGMLPFVSQARKLEPSHCGKAQAYTQVKLGEEKLLLAVWTIDFWIKFQIEGIFEKEKDSFERCLPQNCSNTAISKLQTPKETKIYKFALKPPKLPEGPLWASSSRRVLSHHKGVDSA